MDLLGGEMYCNTIGDLSHTFAATIGTTNAEGSGGSEVMVGTVSAIVVGSM